MRQYFPENDIVQSIQCKRGKSGWLSLDTMLPKSNKSGIFKLPCEHEYFNVPAPLAFQA